MPRLPRRLQPALGALLAVIAWRAEPGRAPGELLPMLTVTVSVDSVYQPENLPSGTGGFVVRNTGTTTILNIGMTCTPTGPVACLSVSPSFVSSLAPGGTAEVEVFYTTGSAGAGSITLTATGKTGSPASKTQVVTVLASPAITIAAPLVGGGNRAVVRTRQPRVSALLTAGGANPLQAIDTTSIQLTWRGVDVTTQARVNRGLVEWEPDSAQGLGTVGSSSADSAVLTVRACSVVQGCTTVSPRVVLPNDQKPVLGFTAVPYEALGRAFSSPFGPGLSVTAGEVEAGVSTVPYVSMGSPRSTGLVYSTRQSYPRALVPVDLELTWPAGTPDDITFVLKDGATRLDSVRFVSPTCATGAVRRCRAVLQGDFGGSTFSTPTRKWLRVEGRVKSGATTNTSIDSVEVVLVDRRATRYGAGWWPSAGVQLVSAGSDRLLVAPTGAVSIFRGNGDSLFLAPPGSEVVLKKAGTSFELAPRGSRAKSVYDANGRLSYAADINGNRDSVVWEAGTDKILKVKDPVGKEITFNYTGGGTFTHFASLSGGSLRETRVTIDGATNQLTRDSLPSPTGAPYTTIYAYQSYPGTKTVVLSKRIGVLTDTTIVVYDSTARRRPVQVKLPLVQDSSGASVKPTIGYTAREYQGISAVRPLDSAYVQMTDPRGFWSRSLLNRWGQAVRTWDAVGLLGRAAFLMDGRPQWTEGKVADSSRVWTTYDALRQPVRTFWVRAAGDTLRLDSLVYDASFRVIQQVDSRGKVSSVAYDTLGNPVRTIGPAHDTTFVWYLADGRVDSTRATGAGAVHYTYEATWKNRSQTIGPLAQLMAASYYDGFGRDTLTESKLRVQETADTTHWQWRKVRTWYTGSNEVDSTRLMRGDNCMDPCNSPEYPVSFDSLHQQSVGWRRDRAGRDTARVDTRGMATLTRLDRLGRVVSRRPWADSAIVKDSLVYDVAGNVVKAITRRGYVITSNYDSRNRDTLSVIPTVGTMRKAFAGPADQLTRQWLVSPVDSIGGVNGELRWAYDLRGRLVADTAYSGTVVRAQTYTYDLWERATARTDAAGTWVTGFEDERGLPNSLVTPLGDSLSLTIDALNRVPSLKSVGPAPHPVQLASRGWNLSGALESFQQDINIFTGSAWTALRFDRITAVDSGGPSLGPLWVRQDGVAAVPDTVRDSVTYDGWNRVIGYTMRSSAGHPSPLTLTYSFDPMGNLFSGAGQLYKPVTNQLWKAGGILTYDDAGNLLTRAAGGWSYGYDALERLVSVRQAGVLIARYGYDVAGRRVVKRVYSGATGGTVGYLRMSYAGSQVGFETDSANTSLSTLYTWGPGVDNLVGLQVHDTAYTVVTDPVGSVRALVRRSDGVWVGRLAYAPYGQLVDSAGPQPVLRYRWTGREWDAETGFYFHRSRYYDPAVGRFVQEDRAGYGGGGNLYAYVEGNVLQARDPEGLYTAVPWTMDPTRAGNCMDAGGSVAPCMAGSPELGGGGGGLQYFRVQVDGGYAGHAVGTPLLGINPYQLDEAVDNYITSRGVPLTPTQIANLGNFCENVLCERVRIHKNKSSVAMTFGHSIYIADPDDVPWLAHEMTHVAQYESWGFFKYYLTALWTHFIEAPFSNVYGIPATLPLDRDFWSYGMEQQGVIVSLCFASPQSDACRVSPYRPNRR